MALQTYSFHIGLRTLSVPKRTFSNPHAKQGKKIKDELIASSTHTSYMFLHVLSSIGIPRSELAIFSALLLQRSITRIGEMRGDGGGVLSTESEYAPTEDTVLALLEILVDPLLPSASSLAINKALSLAQKDSVAKQVQAVVLLYDYYHRQCNPELEFLDHVSFSKLAVVLKPSLLPFMSVMKKEDNNGVDDPDKLSLTDKMIMEGCDISKCLETSKAGIEEWPIAKVAVFLVDSTKNCCFLLHSSNTQGVWSVIEKEHSLDPCPEGLVEKKVGSKKKRITKKPLEENQSVDEIAFRLLAFAVVKETCGCNQKDLAILESHTVYSLSKVKAAVRFYIMQCKRTKEEDDYVPIKDVLDSLQGPLMMKESCGWVTTSVVEYFPLLPYADILSNWFSREPISEASHEAESEQENGEQPSSDSKGEDNNERGQFPVTPHKMSPEKDPEAGNSNTSNEVSAPCKVSPKENLDALNSNAAIETNSIPNEVSTPCDVSPKDDLEARNSDTATKENTSQKIDTGRAVHIVNSVTRSSPLLHIGQGLKYGGRAEEPAETVVYTKRRKYVKKDKVDENFGCKLKKVTAECFVPKDNVIFVCGLSNNMQIDKPVVSSVDCPMDGKNRKNSLLSPPTDALTKDETVLTCQKNREQNGESRSAQFKADLSYDGGLQVTAMIPDQSKPREIDNLQKIISLRENLLSEAALKALHRKRDMLSHQRRRIEDEFALCNRAIQAILNGSEDDLGVKLDSVIEGCNFEYPSQCVSDHRRMYRHSQDQSTQKYLKRKRLCEANLSVPNSCQELDDICHENCWEFPTYNVSTCNGAFEAGVTVKGVDFECSSIGSTCNSPREARETAASSVLTKLRGMTTKPS